MSKQRVVIYKNKERKKVPTQFLCILFVKQNETHLLHIRRYFWALCGNKFCGCTQCTKCLYIAHLESHENASQEYSTFPKHKIHRTLMLKPLIISYVFFVWKNSTRATIVTIEKHFNIWYMVSVQPFGRNAKWMSWQWCAQVYV